MLLQPRWDSTAVVERNHDARVTVECIAGAVIRRASLHLLSRWRRCHRARYGVEKCTIRGCGFGSSCTVPILVIYAVAVPIAWHSMRELPPAKVPYRTDQIYTGCRSSSCQENKGHSTTRLRHSSHCSPIRESKWSEGTYSLYVKARRTLGSREAEG